MNNDKKIEALELLNSISISDDEESKILKLKELIDKEPSEMNHMINDEMVSVMCSCLTEMLVVSKFDWESNDKVLIEQFDFSIFVNGHYHSKPSIFQRLKYAWWHIRTGKTYLDEITLSKEETFKLFTFLKKYFI
jgi:23S rRNA pseudoU1915 N3-methylase RlmH